MYVCDRVCVCVCVCEIYKCDSVLHNTARGSQVAQPWSRGNGHMNTHQLFYVHIT